MRLSLRLRSLSDLMFLAKNSLRKMADRGALKSKCKMNAHNTMQKYVERTHRTWRSQCRETIVKNLKVSRT